MIPTEVEEDSPEVPPQCFKLPQVRKDLLTPSVRQLIWPLLTSRLRPTKLQELRLKPTHRVVNDIVFEDSDVDMAASQNGSAFDMLSIRKLIEESERLDGM